MNGFFFPHGLKMTCNLCIQRNVESKKFYDETEINVV